MKIAILLPICIISSNALPIAVGLHNYIETNDGVLNGLSTFGKITKFYIIDDKRGLGLPPVNIGEGEVFVIKKLQSQIKLM